MAQPQAQQLVAHRSALACRESTALLSRQLPRPGHEFESDHVGIGVLVGGVFGQHMPDDDEQFTLYLFRSPFAGSYLLVKCIDEAQLDENGVLHDKIKMYYAGIHLATMTMAIVINRSLTLDASGAG